MIVVDTNVITHFVIPSSPTGNAERLQEFDCEWIAPDLWRSEFANVLSKYIRWENWTREKALEAFDLAENAIFETRNTNFESVINRLDKCSLSSYDCEFVALAQDFGCKLITLDKKILTEFPNIAVSLLDY